MSEVGLFLTGVAVYFVVATVPTAFQDLSWAAVEVSDFAVSGGSCPPILPPFAVAPYTSPDEEPVNTAAHICFQVALSKPRFLPWMAPMNCQPLRTFQPSEKWPHACHMVTTRSICLV